MNTTKNIIIGLIFTFWITLVATFSIQNIELVSLKFFFFESVQIPIGVLLSIIVGLGFMAGALLTSFSSKTKKSKNNRKKTKFVKQQEPEPEPDPIFDDW